jgi:hypothetical protein
LSRVGHGVGVAFDRALEVGMQPNPPNHGHPGGPSNEHHHPLDDDLELQHIGDFAPPPIEVAPDSDARTAPTDAPPMVRPGSPTHPPIEHVPPLGPLASADSGGAGSRKIRTFEQKLGGGGHEANWKRTPNLTGSGAIHVKSFHCKLTGDSLEFLDAQINQWLDDHPEYEVKMVTTSIGEWTGKLKEPALIVNVWV